eukprot:6643739-Alexandrium_andersonii.AAC.1
MVALVLVPLYAGCQDVRCKGCLPLGNGGPRKRGFCVCKKCNCAPVPLVALESESVAPNCRDAVSLWFTCASALVGRDDTV